MRKIGNLFIVLSLLIGCYVAGEHLYSYYLEKKLLGNTEELSQSLREEMAPRDAEEVQFNNELTLSIPKIDLEIPVLEGTTNDKLRVAVGHLEGSGQLGKVDQNFVVLGHRSHITGKFFNKLDELHKEDEFSFTVARQQFVYQVIDKKIIEPTQLEVLDPIKDKSIVTLITCHPMYSNEQRLVVVAERVS